MNRDDSLSVHVESSLPKSWEVEHTFHDTLYAWMARAPWLAISGAAHGIIILVMWMIPWELLKDDGGVIIKSGTELAEAEEFIDPPPEEPPEELEQEPTEEPVFQDAEISDHNETPNEQDFEKSLGEQDQLSDSPFVGKGDNPVIGIGANGGGPYGGRGGRKNLTNLGGGGTEAIVTHGLEWLRWHQSPDGSWDSDGFMANCGHIQPGMTCDGAGESSHDVGLTGLCMLAFLGNGNTTREGPYKEQVAKAIKWMKDQQDVDTGLYGSRVGHAYMYDHTIATLAMCEAYYFSRSPLLKRSAQEAINYVSRARNPYGAWRYDVAPGDNDTSVTGWAVFAMKSAEEGHLEIDEEAFVGAAQWIDEVTDQATGRTGYDTVGSASSRVPGLNDQYPTDKGEAMTAVAILSRVFMGQEVSKMPVVDKGADLLKAHLPEWDAEGFNNDIYYWYYGSYALFQLGGPRWEAWNKAAKKALVENQRQDGDLKGSWDPKDAWGHAGGRVYMTSLAVLCLEVYFRYARVLGGR
jgi:hypothetical protein